MASPMQLLCPPPPVLTEENLESQKGKVFIVTGGNSGIGKELVTILYSKHAKVYMAARSAEAARKAIADIRALHPSSTGDIIHLSLDLADLSKISSAAAAFLAQETRLDILFNNAGLMTPPDGTKTAQGYEVQMGVNSIGTWMFTRLLNPILLKTARTAAKGSVRVVWVSSSAAVAAPKPAIDFGNMDYRKKDESSMVKYQRSKVGTIALAGEAARRSRKNGEGVLHVSVDPGIYRTNLQRDFSKILAAVVSVVGKHPKFGAYTEIFAGLHQSIGGDDTGTIVIPCGRVVPCREDLVSEELGVRFWDWVEQQTHPYLSK